MSTLSKVNFKILDMSGKNYLSWVLDAEVHLGASSLDKTITKDNKESQEDRSKALIFIRHYLDEALKSRYLTVKDTYTLWTKLKDRFDHQKTVILPRARYEWMHLRLQNFKSQYRERQFKKYSKLISCLLVAEQNNESLLKNHQSHPAGSTVAPEMNATESRGNAPESCGKGYKHWLGPKTPNNKKKASIKGKEKKAETNFLQYDIPMDIAHLDISDFKNDGNDIEDMDSFLKDI
ncbi:uncharacterized protein LOC113315628 [Papaver somniferum]|uniref:uncharacterized protein LOC113315628 n=1 Tax=Papaver somniferum TaxID=3469 RepID=UPI000E6FD84A|nr:uncharacterized protein LOC113315628 [Papaver somniferum]